MSFVGAEAGLEWAIPALRIASVPVMPLSIVRDLLLAHGSII